MNLLDIEEYLLLFSVNHNPGKYSQRQNPQQDKSLKNGEINVKQCAAYVHQNTVLLQKDQSQKDPIRM
jgi:hypothetical protein